MFFNAKFILSNVKKDVAFLRSRSGAHPSSTENSSTAERSIFYGNFQLLLCKILVRRKLVFRVFVSLEFRLNMVSIPKVRPRAVVATLLKWRQIESVDTNKSAQDNLMKLHSLFEKWANPGLFLIYLCLFKHTLQILQQIGI